MEQGAHFVLVQRWGRIKEDGSQRKDPARGWRTNWRQRRPGFVEIKDHIIQGGMLGIIPASLGCTVLDVDTGDPTQLICDHLLWAVVLSQRPGRLLLWYRDDDGPRGNANFAGAEGCSGQVISDKGYVVLWNNSLQDLAEALDYGHSAGRASFGEVRQTLNLRGIESRSTAEQEITRPAPAPTAPAPRRPGDAVDLSTAFPGHRNEAIFDYLRFWAYENRPQYEDFDTFHQELLEHAFEGYSLIPDITDFPEADVRANASSVARGVWTFHPEERTESDRRNKGGKAGLGDFGYRGDPALKADSEVQRYRRSCRSALDADRVAHRTRYAAARFVTGSSVTTIAEKLNVHSRTVQRYVAAAELPSKRKAKRTMAIEHGKTRRRNTTLSQAAHHGTAEFTGAQTAPTRLKSTLPDRHQEPTQVPSKSHPSPKTFSRRMRQSAPP